MVNFEFKCSGSYLKKTYHYEYKIRTVLSNSGGSLTNYRRYSDFEWLHNYYSTNIKYLGVLIPKLPEKHSAIENIKNLIVYEDQSFLLKRKKVNL